MTIRELIKEIEGENPDRIVVDSSGLEITSVEIDPKFALLPNTIEIS